MICLFRPSVFRQADLVVGQQRALGVVNRFDGHHVLDQRLVVFALRVREPALSVENQVEVSRAVTNVAPQCLRFQRRQLLFGRNAAVVIQFRADVGSVEFADRIAQVVRYIALLFIHQRALSGKF